ncbi:hypothetical protein MiSe_95200 [Microseira wollei NIES-4236]|uniref:Uncharacterized protein n=1 Tax=Microseira wollei NIES-4236 TaxID=2530354 RepID=A0AAV3XP29_9CYAN|nr:hypothetical protein MiSe_95200 [Microseira wollei NIES-4236]
MRYFKYALSFAAGDKGASPENTASLPDTASCLYPTDINL